MTMKQILVKTWRLCKGMQVFPIYLDQGPFCGATNWPNLGLCVTLPVGFKAMVVLLLLYLTFLCIVNLKVRSGATPVFSTDRGIHCKCMCKRIFSKFSVIPLCIAGSGLEEWYTVHALWRCSGMGRLQNGYQRCHETEVALAHHG